jgi:hypothetical protein
LTVNTTTTSDPPDQTVCQGATANFSTTATGTSLHYAWTVDGSPFDGDNSSISVPTGSLSVGPHTVSVTTTGDCGSASQTATLTVQANTTPLLLTSQLANWHEQLLDRHQELVHSFVGAGIVLVNSSLGGPVTITGGATTSTLTISSAQSGDSEV